MHLRFLRLFSSYHAISSSIRKSTRCIVCPHLSFRAGLHNFKEHLELGIISRAAFRISNISSFSLPFGTFCWCIDNPSLIWSFLYYHFLTSLKNGDSERLMTLMPWSSILRAACMYIMCGYSYSELTGAPFNLIWIIREIDIIAKARKRKCKLSRKEKVPHR
jgi:hypothetical protein